MTNFLIADMIRQEGGHITAPAALPPGFDDADSFVEFCGAALEAAAFFDVSVASELFWNGRQDYYELDKDFGPLRPPYPVMWMEWDVPDRVLIEGQWVDGQRSHWAALVTTTEEVNAEVEVMVRLFFTRSDGRIPALDGRLVRGVEMLPILKRMRIDAVTGRYVYDSGADLIPNSATDDPQTLHDMKLLSDAHVVVVWMALQLINCRNVTTRQQGSVFTRSGTEKRQGVPVTRYHTIVLPGTEINGDRHKGKGRSKQDVLAMHKVRGHFKRYTAEAPLMGKHVGTYWWGWQVRGKPEHGTVIADYKFNGAITEKPTRDG